MMKKLLALLMMAAVLFTFASCGDEAAGSGSSAADSSNLLTEGCWDELDGQATADAYEVVYTYANSVAASSDSSYVNIIIGIKNKTAYPMGMGSSSCKLYDSNNNVLTGEYDATLTGVNYTIEPGGTGYLYGLSIVDGSYSGQLKCELNDDRVDLTVYHRDDFQPDDTVFTYSGKRGDVTVDDDLARIRMTGTVKNDRDVDAERIYISVIGYDSSGNPICVFSGEVDAKAGEEVAFNLMSEVHGSISPDDIASYSEVYAYSYT